ncbi:MAG TPA: hypothetical protein VHE35_25255 [Kofleriaceae bacterium]|nr:hypothetical protein [Kofleriaceae bacterium]
MLSDCGCLARIGAPIGALLLGAAGCVVPPDLAPANDDATAPNSPPIVVSVADKFGNPFTRPGPRSVTIGDDRLTVTVSDNDVDDTLTLWFFVDYGLPAPTARRSQCLAPPSSAGTAERTVLCEIDTVCLDGDPASNPHILELEVFDRTPDDNGEPEFRSVAPPGLSTGWWWEMNCMEGSS